MFKTRGTKTVRINIPFLPLSRGTIYTVQHGAPPENELGPMHVNIWQAIKSVGSSDILILYWKR